MYSGYDDTICAPATIPGTGAITIIRVSGPKALEIADKVVSCRQGASVAGPAGDTAGDTAGNRTCSSGTIASAPGYTIRFGTIYDEKKKPLDDVLVSIFRAPHSYTGEDSEEISCHASKYIADTIMRMLIAAGARTAEPGEFTRRAFVNGKMDLAQAEAVADLIASQNAAAHRVAVNQLKGGFSRELKKMRDKMLHIVSLMELELDFSDEDVQFADRDELDSLLKSTIRHISTLLESFRLGNVIKNGVPVAIVGETNAGKSTLLNRLLHDDKAIVSDIRGTTRDAIEDTINLGGITFRFIDTAGIRDTSDKIESIGIDRTFQKIDNASVILWMIDGTQGTGNIRETAERIMPHCQGKQLIAVINKSDKLDNSTIQAIQSEISHIHDGISTIAISAKNDIAVDRLEKMLVESAGIPENDPNAVVVTNARHYGALCHAQEAIRRAITGLQSGLSGDFVSQDIRECMHYLGEITGEITTHEILGSIFSRFCIGK